MPRVRARHPQVWRLLDPTGALIPLELRSKRISNVSGGRKKTLLRTLGLQGSATSALRTEEQDGGEPEGRTLALQGFQFFFYGACWGPGL